MRERNGYLGFDDRLAAVKLVPSRWAVAVLIGAPSLSIVTMAALVTRREGALLMTSLWLMPIVVACCAATLITVRHERFNRLAPRRLRRGMCPRCRYPIGDLPREEDSCTICPECGAAWKVGEADGQAGRIV